jgi:gas vesicle protein
MTSTSKFLLSMLGAAAAGAAIALLVAPQRGADLRKKMKSGAEELTDQMGDLVSSSRKKMNEVKTRVNETMADLQERR